MRRSFGTTIGMAGRGEMIPNDDCYCELDPEVKDSWGIPVLRFHWKWAEHETAAGRAYAHDDAGAFRPHGRQAHRHRAMPTAGKISAGGEMIHEVGTARMGATEDRWSIRYGQAWDVPASVDGRIGAASNPDKNPTLSIMALAWRSSAHCSSVEGGRAVSDDTYRDRPAGHPAMAARRGRRLGVPLRGAYAAPAAAGSRPGRCARRGQPRPATAPIRRCSSRWCPGRGRFRRPAADGAALCDTILPAEGAAPGAERDRIQDFVDEWVSAPYPEQRGDRPCC